MRPAFSKHFGAFGLGTVDYERCGSCGLVLSRTHAEMSVADWERLNREFHATYQGTAFDPGDPRWLPRLMSQASVLADVRALGWVPRGRWLDYACGDGKLSVFARERHDLALLNHDRYMRAGPGWLDEGELAERGFELVITTSVIEHLAHRAHLDFIESLVAPGGAFAFHTLVCESVPDDPSWFYLVPAHCAFHTNRGMEILFRQWGFDWSVYCVEAQLWLWFRGDAAGAQARVVAANAREGKPHYEFKRGFVDYWKVDPRQRAAPAADARTAP